jgi:hypothetical protein
MITLLVSVSKYVSPAVGELGRVDDVTVFKVAMCYSGSEASPSTSETLETISSAFHLP